jgi:hypothetical protein
MPRRLPLTVGLLAASAIGCLSHQEAVTNSATADELGNIVVSRRTLTAQGGRVDWCALKNRHSESRPDLLTPGSLFIVARLTKVVLEFFRQDLNIHKWSQIAGRIKFHLSFGAHHLKIIAL